MVIMWILKSAKSVPALRGGDEQLRQQTKAARLSEEA